LPSLKTDALISLLTSNGTLDLNNHEVKLLFSRRQLPPPKPSLSQQQQQPPTSLNKPPTNSPWRNLVTPSLSSKEEPDDGTRLLATLVAIDEKGVITTKIEPEGDGRNVAEAFRAFKRDVEIQLERLLRSVPTAVAGGGLPKTATTTTTSVAGGGERERPRSFAAAVDRVGIVVDAPPAYGDVKKG
jgi:hypothetical protein